MREISRALAGVLERIPARDAAGIEELGKALVAGGPAFVDELVENVGRPGDPKGVKPRYALHALAVYSGRPGAEAERKAFARALAAGLDKDLTAEEKSFLVEQLQVCGGPEEIPHLARWLDHDRLCEPVTQALLAIKGEKALAVLREVLWKVHGARRVTISQAVEILSRR